MALSRTYPVFCVARTVAGLVSSFSQTLPPATVADIYIRQVRGSKMSAYGVSVIIAPVVAPFICGLVVSCLPPKVIRLIVETRYIHHFFLLTTD
jgi:MFS family permease